MSRVITVILLVCTSSIVAAQSAGRIVVTIGLEGVRIPAVSVELRSVDRNVVVGQSTSDAIGQVAFPDVPPGRYLVRAVREGFANAESAPFTVDAGETEQVLVEMRLTFVRESVEVVVPANSPTESLQPVAVSDVLTGAKMDIQPLAGDDFQSLMTMLPSIVRDPQGRLRIKGGSPTSGALQISSASLNDPSTGDFDLELPSGAVESVEVLSNPFAAEYGRFSTSVTQVRTKRGTNDWIIKPDNLIPGFGKGFAFVNKFEPRLSISGPLKRDRLLFGQYFQYRFVRTRGEEPSWRSAARARQLRLVHAARRGAVVASRAHRRRHLFSAQDHERDDVDVPARGNDAEVHAVGILCRCRRSADRVRACIPRVDGCRAVSSRSIRRPRVELPMVYAPQTQSGNFFSRQERNVRSLQAVEALTYSKDKLGRRASVQGRRRPPALAASTATATASRSTWSASTDRWPSGRRLRPAPGASRRHRHRVRGVRARIGGASTIA